MNSIASQHSINDTDTVDKADLPSIPVTLPTKNPLNIALLGYRSHPFVGGQGIYIKYLSRALHAMGHTVHVYSGQPYPELDTGIKLIKVPSLNLYETDSHVRALRWHHWRSFADVYEWWTMLTGGFAEPYTFGRRVRKALRHCQYDIIHDNQSLCSGLLDLQRQGHTVISTIHHPIHRDRELALQDAPDWGFRLLVKRWHSFLNMQENVVSKLKHVITVSTQSQHDIETFFKRSAVSTPIIFNGVDTTLFKPLAHMPNSALNILTTSSSDQPLKGLRFLIEAMPALIQAHPALTLNIIGELKPNGTNANLIKKLKLKNHIHCHTKLTTEALIEKYNQATVVICPSLYEGFGLPAAEAMACARPVISSDGGALPEVIGDAGIVVPAGNSTALHIEIHALLINKARRDELGKRARARAVNTFCWQRVAGELTDYYHQCLNEKST